MKLVRLLFVFLTVVSIFFISSFFQVRASAANPGDVNSAPSPTYFFGYDSLTNARAKYTDPTSINYSQTAAMVWNRSFLEITEGLIGSPAVKNTSGKTVKSTGALQFFADNIIYMTTTPVLSGSDYIAYNVEKLKVPGFAPAYAAETDGGTGYRSLFPVLRLWTLTRNVAYLFFAVVFVVIGVMMIVGKRIDPKTVLAIQTAFPKIIISLVLVTFSYAIAGFVIDIMYVAINVIFAALGPLLNNQKDLSDAIKNGENIFQFFTRTPWVETGGGVAKASASVGSQVFGSIGGQIGEAVGGAFTGVIGGVLVNLILAIVIFYSLFKIWLKLIMTYIYIILGVVTGPFLIMMDALPKPNQSNFQTWLKGIIGNAAIYPMLIILLLVSMIITAGVGEIGGIGNDSFIGPLTGVGQAAVAQTIIGIAMLISIPGILDKVPGMFGAGKGVADTYGGMWAPALTAAGGFAANNAVSKKLGEGRELAKKAEDEVKAGLLKDRIKKEYLAKRGRIEVPEVPQMSKDAIQKMQSLMGEVNSANSPIGRKAAAMGGWNAFYNKYKDKYTTYNEKRDMLATLLNRNSANDLTMDDELYFNALNELSARDAAVKKHLDALEDVKKWNSNPFNRIPRLAEEKLRDIQVGAGTSSKLGKLSNAPKFIGGIASWIGGKNK